MSKHILLCDDELPIIRAAQIKLERAGYRVDCRGDGQAALEFIRSEAPDLLITDCQMPRMGGLELIRNLREGEHAFDFPIIMLTGKGLELPHDELRERFGVVRVVSKPFSPREMVQFVDDLFATSAV